jgi:hypothetical protein
MAFSASRFTKVKETRKVRVLCYTLYIRAGAKVSDVKDILFCPDRGYAAAKPILNRPLVVKGLETVGNVTRRNHSNA